MSRSNESYEREERDEVARENREWSDAQSEQVEQWRISRVPLRERWTRPWLFPYPWLRWELERWNAPARWWDFCCCATTKRTLREWIAEYEALP